MATKSLSGGSVFVDALTSIKSLSLSFCLFLSAHETTFHPLSDKDGTFHM